MIGELDQRKAAILRAIVEEYIAKGEPIGSQQIAKLPEIEVGPASIRAVMADLEELGYLEKPHTSAGRVPTNLGYRFFVDSLVHIRQPLPREREAIERSVPEASGVELAIEQASRALHDLSRYASVVLVPRPEEASIRHIEFVRLRDDRALAVLVSQSGMVQNRLIQLPEPMSQAELTQAGNYLDELLKELTLESARERVAGELAADTLNYEKLQRQALQLAQGLMQPNTASDPVRVQGQNALLEAFDLDQARAALRVLEEKKRILQVLDQTRSAKQMQIFIGAESGFHTDGLALVATPFGQGEVLGTLGVIGPTRMNYPKVIALVDYTARALTRALVL